MTANNRSAAELVEKHARDAVRQFFNEWMLADDEQIVEGSADKMAQLIDKWHGKVEDSALLSELEAGREAREREAKLIDVLREIAKGEGPFSRDQLTHASNTIDAMIKLATDALASSPGKEGEVG